MKQWTRRRGASQARRHTWLTIILLALLGGVTLAWDALSTPTAPPMWSSRTFRLNCFLIDTSIKIPPATEGWSGPLVFWGYACENGELVFVPQDIPEKRDTPRRTPPGRRLEVHGVAPERDEG